MFPELVCLSSPYQGIVPLGTEYRIQNTEFISHMYIHVMHYNNNNNYRKIS